MLTLRSPLEIISMTTGRRKQANLKSAIVGRRGPRLVGAKRNAEGAVRTSCTSPLAERPITPFPSTRAPSDRPENVPVSVAVRPDEEGPEDDARRRRATPFVGRAPLVGARLLARVEGRVLLACGHGWAWTWSRALWAGFCGFFCVGGAGGVRRWRRRRQRPTIASCNAWCDALAAGSCASPL